jgi:hypothetical protein
MRPGPVALPVAERFAKYVHPEPNSGCWLWVGNAIPHGYGIIRINKPRTQRLAHRVSWQVHRGDIPTGLCVLHRCDNRLCDNPDHLFLGTQRDNLQDMLRKGRDRWSKTTERSQTPEAIRGRLRRAKG